VSNTLRLVRVKRGAPSSRHDRLAEWRLGHAKPVGRLAEMQRLGDGDEMTKLADVDIHIHGDLIST
jgi:hypothetical protein